MDMDENWLAINLRTFIEENKINLTTYFPCDANETNSTQEGCGQEDNLIDDIFVFGSEKHGRTVGESFFTYVTPFIFIIGVVGNTLSLMVFLTKRMRRLSASFYLASISMADLMALVFYVVIEWIRRGLPEFENSYVEFIEKNGVCHVILFLIYNFRFLSSWLVVCFTIERYIGVCHPLKRRRNISDMSSSRKLILVMTIISICIALFRPWLNKEHHIGPTKMPWCVRRMEYRTISFIYDCLFGISTTFIPFVIITVLNALIIRKLIKRNRRCRKTRIITEESIIRLEFTLTLIAVSLCFVVFNTPYAIVWLIHFIRAHSKIMLIGKMIDNTQNVLFFTKTIYFMNYSVNFFLYSITGAYFRRELKMLFTCQSKSSKSYYQSSVRTTTSMVSRSLEEKHPA